MRSKLLVALTVVVATLLLVTNPVIADAAGKITGKQIKDNSVTGKDIKDGSLLKGDFAAGQIPAGPAGPAGPTGPAGASSTTPVAAGQTISGTGVYDITTSTTDVNDVVHVDLPGRAAAPLTNATVNFAADTRPATTDDDATCTGTFAAPMAPKGKVCIYNDPNGNNGIGSIESVSGNVAYPDNDLWARSGFDLFVTATTDNVDVFLFFSWAYTA